MGTQEGERGRFGVLTTETGAAGFHGDRRGLRWQETGAAELLNRAISLLKIDKNRGEESRARTR